MKLLTIVSNAITLEIVDNFVDKTVDNSIFAPKKCKKL